MRHQATLAAITLTLLAGCSSTTPKSEVTAAPAMQAAEQTSRASDQKMTELQTSINELIDRLEVMSDRIQRLEGAQTQTASVPAPPPQPRVAEAASRAEPAAQAGAPSGTTRPLAGASARQPEPATSPVAGERRSVPPAPLAGAMIAGQYRSALELYAKGRVADARKGFQSVFDADPNGELADNALYWIGETYFAAANYTTALKYYQRIARDYSDQNKAPDAMYKAGVVYVKTGDLQLAKQTFEECIRKYPYSTPASSAKLELARIKY